VNALKVIELTSANTESLIVSAGTGNDTITVSGTGCPAFLTVQGGGQSSSSGSGDRLVFLAGAAGTTTVSPGASADAGLITAPGAHRADDVAFFEIENLTVNGNALSDTLTAQGTHANDTIALQNLGGSNLIWINDRAVITFVGYANVNLQGRFGDDKINVHPVGLIGVTAINAAGVADGAQTVVIRPDAIESDEQDVTGSVALSMFKASN